jgi:hypothetical protein
MHPNASVRELLSRPADTDTIDRRIAASVLKVTVRTLLRWGMIGETGRP